MKDSKLNERMKRFQSDPPNLLKRREEVALSLRKEKLFDALMEKRISRSKSSDGRNYLIDPATLNVNPNMIEAYESANNDKKFDYLSSWLTETDSSSAFNLMSDNRKYALYQFRVITEDLSLEPDEDLQLKDELIQVLLYELFGSQELIVKFEISQILMNLTNDSKILCEKLADADYFQNFFLLSYSNCVPLIENLLIIMGNILYDNNKETTEYIITHAPIIMRLKEMLVSPDLEKNPSILCGILFLLKTIVYKVSEDKFIIFVDFIVLFTKVFETNAYGDEESLFYLLHILVYLARDEKNISEKIVSCNIVEHVLEILKRKLLEQNLVLLCVRILGNLSFTDKIVDYLLQRNILDIYEKILNSYMNTTNENDKQIILEVIWAVSNITAGNETHNDRVVLSSKVIKIILSINKHKKDPKILFESIFTISNVLSKGSNQAAMEIIRINSLVLICEGINSYENVDLLHISLSTVFKIIKASRGTLGFHSNIKKDLISQNALIKIEKSMNHLNEEISKKATRIINILELSDSEKDICQEDLMDYDEL